MKKRLVLLTAFCSFMALDQLNAAEKPTLVRSWIGGEYETARPALVPAKRQSAVYVKQVYPGTPASDAGLRPGDLILRLGHRRVRNCREFYRILDDVGPGSQVSVNLLRRGEPIEIPVTVGREKYQSWHAFSIGLGAATHFDLWPNPDFSLLPVASYKRPWRRTELRSPEITLARQVAGSNEKGESGVRSDEGWDAWFLIFGVNAHKRILSQEVVSSSTAMR